MFKNREICIARLLFQVSANTILVLLPLRHAVHTNAQTLGRKRTETQEPDKRKRTQKIDTAHYHMYRGHRCIYRK
jgi:hypothetical protein